MDSITFLTCTPPFGLTDCEANPSLTTSRRRCMVFARDDPTTAEADRI